MKRKLYYGSIILILLAFSIFVLLDEINPKQKSKDLVEKRKESEEIYKSNIIKNINYSSKDLKGNKYIILAEEGEIDLVNSDIIFLKNVSARIELKEKNEIITISSDFGKYNSFNFDTIFSKNVVIKYLNNRINSEYLDYSMEKNLIIITKNVIYRSPENILKADVIELDTLSKDTKIFMYDSKRKVNIKSIN